MLNEISPTSPPPFPQPSERQHDRNSERKLPTVTQSPAIPKQDFNMDGSDKYLSTRALDEIADLGYISPAQLSVYLSTQPTANIWLLDIRPRAQFNHDHILSPLVFCIPPFLLQRPLGQIDLEELLLSQSRLSSLYLYEDQKDVDLVVCYDQSSTIIPSSTKAIQSNALCNLVYSITYTFQQKRSLKRKPVLLNGGIDAWYSFQRQKEPLKFILVHAWHNLRVEAYHSFEVMTCMIRCITANLLCIARYLALWIYHNPLFPQLILITLFILFILKILQAVTAIAGIV
jgi:hypothetical protein